MPTFVAYLVGNVSRRFDYYRKKEKEMRAKPERRAGATGADSRKQIGIIIGIAGIGLIGLIALLVLNLREPADISGLVRFTGLSNAHDDNIVYPPAPLPPAGGVHGSTWQNCGIYDEPVETKYALHSLEHGAVWVTYPPDTPASDIAALQTMARGHSYIILSPFEGQESAVALTAWGFQLEVDSVRDRRIAQFMERYERGPQTLEPFGSCQGAVGTPIDRG